MEFYFVSMKTVESKDKQKQYYFAGFTDGQDSFSQFLTSEQFNKLFKLGLKIGDIVHLDFEPIIYNGKLQFRLKDIY